MKNKLKETFSSAEPQATEPHWPVFWGWVAAASIPAEAMPGGEVAGACAEGSGSQRGKAWWSPEVQGTHRVTAGF